MKHDLRPEWDIVRPLLFYMLAMIGVAWVAHTFFHVSLSPPFFTTPVHPVR